MPRRDRPLPTRPDGRGPGETRPPGVAGGAAPPAVLRPDRPAPEPERSTPSSPKSAEAWRPRWWTACSARPHSASAGGGTGWMWPDTPNPHPAGLVQAKAWRYRDYVIDAFNRDLPFDRFVPRADRRRPPARRHRRPRRAEPVRRHSFLASATHNLEEQDKSQLRTGRGGRATRHPRKAFLAQAHACARCHDHKFDPIPTRDYHALAGILPAPKAGPRQRVGLGGGAAAARSRRRGEAEGHERRLAALEAEMKAAEKACESAIAADPSRRSAAMPEVVAVKDVPGVMVDDAAAKKVGAWQHSTHTKSYIGDGYLHDQTRARARRRSPSRPPSPAGRYEVRLAVLPAATAIRRAGDGFGADGDILGEHEERAPPLDGRFVPLGESGSRTGRLRHRVQRGHPRLRRRGRVVFLPVGSWPPHRPTAADGRQPAAERTGRRSGPDHQEIGAPGAGPDTAPMPGVKEEKAIEDLPVSRPRRRPQPSGDPVPRGFLRVACPPEQRHPRFRRTRAGGSNSPTGWRRRTTRSPPACSSTVPGTGCSARVVPHGGQLRHHRRSALPPRTARLTWPAASSTDGWSVKRLVREIVAEPRLPRLASPADRRSSDRGRSRKPPVRPRQPPPAGRRVLRDRC